MNNVIDVQHVTKSYGGRRAVDDVSLQVREGEILAILGPNGAGKSTLVEAIAGLRTIDSGQIRVLGLDPREDRLELRQQVGVQLQESALPDNLRVWEALDMYASFDPNMTTVTRTIIRGSVATIGRQPPRLCLAARDASGGGILGTAHDHHRMSVFPAWQLVLDALVVSIASLVLLRWRFR